ncbi:dTMP kinase [Citricoccus sp. K5]|uniref:dTMP kinase n=1 Tax=Citricoccus sp. K5 TaxID=2653135 RepID=UPI0012F0517B|nr:dTMP kinase [Citricoccus sp. K5]VXA91201.1 thymidylate kinase [Citricoccus sp. K5]
MIEQPSTSSGPVPLPTGPQGLFIAFEGGDGSGKSTQARLLAERLTAEGHEVLLTREPGGTDVGEQLRSLVLDPAHAPIDPVTEALIFASARSAHVRQLIGPALAAGRTVVTDRYVDSSVAYQGAGRGLGTETVAGINEWATGGLHPDLTVLLDVDTGTAATRRADRAKAAGGTGPDRLESEPEPFHQRIRTAFTDRAALAPDRYLVLDAGRPALEIAAEVWGRVAGTLGREAGR